MHTNPKSTSTLLSLLQDCKNQDHFPPAAWETRGLVASPEDVQHGMNLAVVEFIDFLLTQLTDDVSGIALQEKVQEYFDERDNYDFDTEEREWIVDVQCELAQLAGIDCSKLFI